MDGGMSDDWTKDGPMSDATETTSGATLPDMPPTATASAPFDWRRFAVHLGTFMLVVLLIGIGAAVVLGRKPLAKTVATSVASRGLSLEIQWPLMQAEQVKGKSAQGKNTKPKQAGASISTTSLKPGAESPVPAARTWMPEQFQEQLLTTGMRALGGAPDPLSREPLDRLGSAMAESGWFAGVPTIERHENGKIMVKGLWRVPAAVVRVDDKDHLISWDARPMPVVYEQALSGLRVISGAALGPTLKPDGTKDFSKAWAGEDVEAAIELLALLVQQPYANQIAGIDLSMYASKKWLVIDTTMGTRIIWGGRPSKPLNGECSTNHKLAKIEKLRREVGRIDAGVGAIEVWWPIDRALQIDLTATAARAAEEQAARELEAKNTRKPGSKPVAKPATR